MTAEPWGIFSLFGFFIILLSICGFYCILVTRNLIRVIIGLELLIKAVTLLIIVAGYVTGKTALCQGLVITVIVIEVIVVVVAGGLVLNSYRINGDLDARHLERLKG